MNLLDGTFEGKKFHIGANEGQDVTIKVNDMAAKALSVDGNEYKTSGAGAITVHSRNKDITVKIEAAAVSGGGEGATAKMSGNVAVVTVNILSGTGITSTNANVKAALEKLGLNATVSGTLASGTTAAGVITQSGLGIDISTQASASKSITTINNALETVSKERSKLGAIQNRLEHTIKNLDTSAENLQASESRIRDVDMAKEMMEQTKQNILQQASTAMLAQANQAPQTVLQLLR
ncbi:hypothetical protein KQI38_01795 [Tissierella carlieri]|nr:hypothetical protein [Tissierella carlieri]